MKILLLSSAYNSLTQQAHVGLKYLKHDVTVAQVQNGQAMRAAVEQCQPDLILCPMLARIIPEDIWRNHTCIVVHPGIVGDRGPASLDWAILNEETEWGVTAVEAAEHPDSGPIWATYHFKMRRTSKSSLYRDEVTSAAIKAMMVAVRRFESGLFVPTPLDYSRPNVRGCCRPAVNQAQRKIDWDSESTSVILKKICSADGSPGVLDDIEGEAFYLFGGHEEGKLVGRPGEIIAQRYGAVCRAAVDGAVWISHLKRQSNHQNSCFKLPAAQVLGARVAYVPEIPVALDYRGNTKTFRDIWYQEHNQVGYVNFSFYNGAMSTDQCIRLAQAVFYARQRPTKVIVLSGGRDFWSNGIHLNIIEAADDPAEESWHNINAMNDLVYSILAATDHITVAAMYGSAGAGGVMMALAADRVFARESIVLNPHYKSMGGLYGSEYWTYSLPKRVGADLARQLMDQCLPMSVQEAKAIGLIDDIILQDDYEACNFSQFGSQTVRIAEKIAHSPRYDQFVAEKWTAREVDERVKPLAQYRAEELAEMKHNFYGEDRSYHIARSSFVRKNGAMDNVRQNSSTPATQGPEPVSISPNAAVPYQHLEAYQL